MARIEDYSRDGYIFITDLLVGGIYGREITALISNMEIKPTMEKFVAWVQKQSEEAINKYDDGETPLRVYGPDGRTITIHRKWQVADNQVNIVAVPVENPTIFVAKDEHFVSFPAWALVSFATRCARRALSVYNSSDPRVSPGHVQVIEDAIRLAEGTKPSTQKLDRAKRRIKSAIEAVGGLQTMVSQMTIQNVAAAAASVAEMALELIEKPSPKLAAAACNLAMTACSFGEANNQDPSYVQKIFYQEYLTMVRQIPLQSNPSQQGAV